MNGFKYNDRTGHWSETKKPKNPYKSSGFYATPGWNTQLTPGDEYRNMSDFVLGNDDAFKLWDMNSAMRNPVSHSRRNLMNEFSPKTTTSDSNDWSNWLNVGKGLLDAYDIYQSTQLGKEQNRTARDLLDWKQTAWTAQDERQNKALGIQIDDKNMKRGFLNKYLVAQGRGDEQVGMIGDQELRLPTVATS